MLAFSPKDPADTDDFRVNLPLAVGDAVASIQAVTVSPSGLSESVPDRVLDGTGLTMRFSGGLDGVDYRVTIRYATTAGRIRSGSVADEVLARL